MWKFLPFFQADWNYDRRECVRKKNNDRIVTLYGLNVISALSAMVIGFQTVLSIHTVLVFEAVSVMQMAKHQG